MQVKLCIVRSGVGEGGLYFGELELIFLQNLFYKNTGESFSWKENSS
jgi:hypothetical protein